MELLNRLAAQVVLVRAAQGLLLGGLLAPAASPLAAQPTWSVAPRPLFDVSGVLAPDGTVMERPVGAVVTSAGRVLVADAMAGTVLVFDGEGRYLRRAGQPGKGPDEFQGIEWIGPCSRDGAVVWDRMAARLTHLAADGTLLRQERAPFEPDVASRTIATSCSRSGTWALLALPREPRPVEGEVIRGASTLTLVGTDGASRPFPVPVTSSEIVARGGGGAPRPLGRTTTVLLDDTRVIVGTADSAFVAVHTHDGREAGGIRVPASERALTKADYEAAVEAIASTLPAAAQKFASDLLLSQPHPRRAAPYYGLHLDPGGLLWVRTSAPTDRVTRFAIHDRDGRAIGSVELPRAITVWDVTSSLVVGHYQDDDGEPHLIAYSYGRR